MDIEMRKAGIDELDTLMEWRMRVLREVFSICEDIDTSVIRENNEAYYKAHLSDGSHTACFAIERESGRIVGCGGICYQAEMPSPDNLTGTNGYLMNIYSLPENRGMGIGRMIIEYLIDDAKKRGTEKIYLESSEAAKKLYRQIGFSAMSDYMKL